MKNCFNQFVTNVKILNKNGSERNENTKKYT